MPTSHVVFDNNAQQRNQPQAKDRATAPLHLADTSVATTATFRFVSGDQP